MGKKKNAPANGLVDFKYKATKLEDGQFHIHMVFNLEDDSVGELEKVVPGDFKLDEAPPALVTAFVAGVILLAKDNVGSTAIH